MAEIKSFKAVLYNTDKVDISKVIMPPYDIIRDTSKYYDMDEHNIVRIDKSREEQGDDETNNKYTRAKATIKQWLAEGVLQFDDKDSLYVYAQEYFTPDGKKHEMVSFFGLVKLEEWEKKVVLPHEKTHAGPKVDRLELMRHTMSNTSPILSLYFDEEKIIDTIIRGFISDSKPAVDIKDDDGIGYRMWKLSGDKAESISEFLRDKQLYIADGHHRYETAINFRNEMREKGDSSGAYDYILMNLISMEHSGISILPTHRLKEKFNIDVEKADDLKKFFKVEIMDGMESLREKMVETTPEKRIGVATKDKCMLLTLNKDEYEKVVDLQAHVMDYYLLDASILHKLLFEKILGLDEAAINSGIDYTPDIDEALDYVRNDKAEITFLLGPATVDEVRKISENDEVMPQKSTYFLPKLATGFLINKMGE